MKFGGLNFTMANHEIDLSAPLQAVTGADHTDAEKCPTTPETIILQVMTAVVPSDQQIAPAKKVEITSWRSASRR